MKKQAKIYGIEGTISGAILDEAVSIFIAFKPVKIARGFETDFESVLHEKQTSLNLQSIGWLRVPQKKAYKYLREK